jgi:hypothetical protein
MARVVHHLARAAGITHVRFIATVFWPRDLVGPTGWGANPDAFFAAFDALVADASARGLHLVPSLLWQPYLFPDQVGAPVGQLFVPGSLARTTAENYIRAVVSRYRGNDTILFWEIGNELNLLADIDESCNVNPDGSCGDHPEQCQVNTAPALGTPSCRTAADNYFSCNACRGVSSAQQDLSQFSEAIAELIHGLDPGKPVSSGDSHPRPSAYHLSYSPCPACDWSPDTEDQYRAALANLHPDAVDVVSVHHYPGDVERFGSTDGAGNALLAVAKDQATTLGKILYVGEFGELSDTTITCGDTQVCGGSAQKFFTTRLLDDFVQVDVPYAAVWAWEFFQFCPAVPTCFDVEPGDATIQAIATHNRAYDSCMGLPDGALCPIGHCLASVCRNL